MKFIQKLATFLVVACALNLTACATKVDTGGYVNDDDIKAKITVGQTSKDFVKNTFGSPSSQSSFGKETWYYMTNRKEGIAFLKPEIVEQNVTAIEFDAQGIVSKVGNYSLNDAQDVSIVSRTTPTEGHQLGFFEQLLGNIGRFNKPDNNSVAPGRKPGGGF